VVAFQVVEGRMGKQRALHRQPINCEPITVLETTSLVPEEFVITMMQHLT